MSHMPGHLDGALADTWRDLQQEAGRQGVDPESQPIVVRDESRRAALDDLALMGGARVEDGPDGAKVYLNFEEPEGGHDEDDEDGDHDAGASAAAKPSKFATDKV